MEKYGSLFVSISKQHCRAALKNLLADGGLCRSMGGCAIFCFRNFAKCRSWGGPGRYSPGASSTLTQIVPYSFSLYTVFHSVIYNSVVVLYILYQIFMRYSIYCTLYSTQKINMNNIKNVCTFVEPALQLVLSPAEEPGYSSLHTLPSWLECMPSFSIKTSPIISADKRILCLVPPNSFALSQFHGISQSRLRFCFT